MSEFRTGDKVRIVGHTEPMTFIGQIGDTVYAIYAAEDGAGYAMDALAYTGAKWEKVPEFFENGRTYRHNYTGTRVTIRHVGKCGKHDVAYGLSTKGGLYLFDGGDFFNWIKE